MKRQKSWRKSEDGFATVCPRHYAGIKIRRADGDCVTRSLDLVNIGRNKKYHRNGEDWDCQNYKDRYSDRAFFLDPFSLWWKSNLKEAYYGKIYGDIEIEGNDWNGLIGISFLYYLNPNSLNRNLEWDMKNNLCPTQEHIHLEVPYESNKSTTVCNSFLPPILNEEWIMMNEELAELFIFQSAIFLVVCPSHIAICEGEWLWVVAKKHKFGIMFAYKRGCKTSCCGLSAGVEV